MFEFNPWWETEEVPKEFLPRRGRFILSSLKEGMKKKYIDLIIGLRRTGKTTLMYQLIDWLLKKGVKPNQILYFSFDERKKELKELVSEYEKRVLRGRLREKKIFLFLDEVHKLEDWADKIKILFDLNPKLKIVASGSASLNLMKSARESLAGRCVFHQLDPLSFKEFLWLKGEKIPKKKVEVLRRKVEIEIFDFLNKGFPEIIDASEKEARRYIKELIIERIIFRDIPESFRIKDLDLLKLLAEYIFSNPGVILNIDSLSRDLGRSKKTIANMLEYLELSFLIRRLSNLRGSFLATSRKNRKGYPFHPSLSLTRDEPKLVECLIGSELNAKYYWKERNKEVDFVIKDRTILPIEVKYKSRVERRDIKSITKFCKKFKLKRGIVVSKDEEKKIDGIEVVPLYKFVLFKNL